MLPPERTTIIYSPFSQWADRLHDLISDFFPSTIRQYAAPTALKNYVMIDGAIDLLLAVPRVVQASGIIEETKYYRSLKGQFPAHFFNIFRKGRSHDWCYNFLDVRYAFGANDDAIRYGIANSLLNHRANLLTPAEVFLYTEIVNGYGGQELE
jgi:hypothetical protein